MSCLFGIYRNDSTTCTACTKIGFLTEGRGYSFQELRMRSNPNGRKLSQNSVSEKESAKSSTICNVCWSPAPACGSHESHPHGTGLLICLVVGVVVDVVVDVVCCGCCFLWTLFVVHVGCWCCWLLMLLVVDVVGC